MLKTLGFLPRRADLGRAAFREYYETRHAPLALRHIRVFAKYVRNHVVRGDPAAPGFDCLSEFWFDEPEAAADIGKWLTSPAGQVLREDEAKFMDRSRIASCAVSERLLFGAERPVESGVVRKLGLALTRAASGTPADFTAQVEKFCDELVHRSSAVAQRVCLDVPMDLLQPNLPLHALISIWPATPDAPIDAPPAAGAIAAITTLTLDAIETPPAALRD